MEINGQVVSRSPASMITAESSITGATTFKDLVEILKCRYLKRLQEVKDEYQQTMGKLLCGVDGEITEDLRRHAVALTLKTMEFRREIHKANSNAIFNYGANDLLILGVYNGSGDPKFLPRVRVHDHATQLPDNECGRTYFTGISPEGDEVFVSFDDELTSLLAITIKNKNGRFTGCVTCAHPKDLMDKQAFTPDMELYHVAVALVMDGYACEKAWDASEL